MQDHLQYLTVARYVERNALPANLVPRARVWRGLSPGVLEQGEAKQRGLGGAGTWIAPKR